MMSMMLNAFVTARIHRTVSGMARYTGRNSSLMKVPDLISTSAASNLAEHFLRRRERAEVVDQSDDQGNAAGKQKSECFAIFEIGEDSDGQEKGSKDGDSAEVGDGVFVFLQLAVGLVDDAQLQRRLAQYVVSSRVQRQN